MTTAVLIVAGVVGVFALAVAVGKVLRANARHYPVVRAYPPPPERGDDAR